MKAGNVTVLIKRDMNLIIEDEYVRYFKKNIVVFKALNC